MDKRMLEKFELMDFKVDGNSAVGYVNGYEVSCAFNKMINPPFFCLVCAHISEEKLGTVYKDLKSLKIPCFVFNVTPFGVNFTLNALTYKKFLLAVSGVIGYVADVLRKNDCSDSNYCPITGEEFGDDKEVVNFNGFNVTMSLEGKQKINEEITRENKEFEASPNNYLKGTIGALIGGLVGIALTILLGYFGYVASLSAIISMALGAFLYGKFGGKRNAMMIVIVSIVTLVSMALGVYLLYLIIFQQEIVKNGWTDVTAFTLLNENLKENGELSSLFVRDELLNLVFTVIGIVVMIFSLRKAIHRGETLK